MSELKEKSIFGTDGIRGMVNQYPQMVSEEW